MQRCDVIVVGGGLVGASFTLALTNAGLTVALIEPHEQRALPDDDSWDNRVYALSPGNAAWLTELGVWERVPPARVTRIEAMQIYGDQPAGRLAFSAYDAGLRELAHIIENRLLQGELWNALDSASHVTRFCPGRCVEVSWERGVAVVTLDTGDQVATRLLVGADGADSWVRAQAGIAARTHDYAQIGVVANFSCVRAHDGTAFQWFRPDGVLALLPLPGRRTSMVWSAPEDRARELLAAPPELLAREVEDASGGVLGALEVIAPAAGFPLRRQRAERMVAQRVALVGDAAHNIHPLAGQGMNLGLRDARELAAVLCARAGRGDCGEYGLLRRYERARQQDIVALELTTEGLEKLFSTHAVWLTGMRNIGLALVDAQPLLKNLLIGRAVA